MDTQLQQLQVYRQQAVELIFPSVESIQDRIAALELELEALTPIEHQHRDEIEKRVLELKLSLLGITETLPYEPLKLRNKEGQPVFALFSLTNKNPVFRLAVKVSDWDEHVFQVSDPSNLPRSIDACFQDMEEHLKARIPRGLFGGLRKQESSMSTSYAGLIPQFAREKINEVKGLFPDIFLIAEADKWDYKVSPAPRPIVERDPLVVGFAHRTIYLITWFDPTTPEKIFLDTAMTGS